MVISRKLPASDLTKTLSRSSAYLPIKSKLTVKETKRHMSTMWLKYDCVEYNFKICTKKPPKIMFVVQCIVKVHMSTHPMTFCNFNKTSFFSSWTKFATDPLHNFKKWEKISDLKCSSYSMFDCTPPPDSILVPGGPELWGSRCSCTPSSTHLHSPKPLQITGEVVNLYSTSTGQFQIVTINLLACWWKQQLLHTVSY